MAGEDAEGGLVKLSPSTRRAITFHPPRYHAPPAALSPSTRRATTCLAYKEGQPSTLPACDYLTCGWPGT